MKKQIIDSKIISLFCNCVVSSVLVYGLSSWFESCDKNLKNKVSKFQCHTCRITDDDVHASVEIPSNVYEQKWVRTDSRIGYFAFPAYSSLLFLIAQKHGVEMHMYADDTQLHHKFKPQEYNWAILKIAECLAEIRTWMSENLLNSMTPRLNSWSLARRIYRVNYLIRDTVIGNEQILASSTARNTSAVLDSHLYMVA